MLPFAPLTKSDSPQDLLTQVAQKINQIEDTEQRQNLASCTGLLSGLRFEENLIRSLFREDIMKESVFYQSIIKEGSKEEAKKLVLRLLNLTVGYHIQATLALHEPAVEAQRNQAGRFVLATNLLDDELWSNDGG